MSYIKLDTHIHMGQRLMNGDVQYNWQIKDLNNFKVPQGKAFFVFGGNTTNRPEAANGNAKVVERLLKEENKEKVNIYSFIYDTEPLDSLTKRLSDNYTEETHELYKKVFKPMLCDKKGNLKEKQGLEKTLKNLVIVSHCGGSDFVDVIIEDIYSTLLEKYHPSEADHIISKLQYYAYAPNILPAHSVNSFVVTPYLDGGHSWAKVLTEAREKRVDIDYPRGVIKKIFKTQQQGDVSDVFNQTFRSDRLIGFKADQSIYLIPSRLNSNAVVGDHSIDCLVKSSVLDAGTDCARTARIINDASKLAINNFASDYSIDTRDMFTKIAQRTFKDKPSIM